MERDRNHVDKIKLETKKDDNTTGRQNKIRAKKG
jgi:hypothetical protein